MTGCGRPLTALQNKLLMETTTVTIRLFVYIDIRYYPDYTTIRPGCISEKYNYHKAYYKQKIWSGRMTRRSPQESSANQPRTGRTRLYVNRRKYLALGAGTTVTLLGTNAAVSTSTQSTTETYWTDFSEVEL